MAILFRPVRVEIGVMKDFHEIYYDFAPREFYKISPNFVVLAFSAGVRQVPWGLAGVRRGPGQGGSKVRRKKNRKEVYIGYSASLPLLKFRRVPSKNRFINPLSSWFAGVDFWLDLNVRGAVD